MSTWTIQGNIWSPAGVGEPAAPAFIYHFVGCDWTHLCRLIAALPLAAQASMTKNAKIASQQQASSTAPNSLESFLRMYVVFARKHLAG